MNSMRPSVKFANVESYHLANSLSFKTLREQCASRVTFLYWQNLCAFNYISGFSWNAANSSGPCRQNKKGANAESSPNNFHSSKLSDNNGFLGNNHLYIIFICRKNILECSPRYVFRTHLRFSPARKFKQIGLGVKTGKTRMLHKLQRRQSEFQIKAQIDFPLTLKTNKFQFQLNWKYFQKWNLNQVAGRLGVSIDYLTIK